MKQLALLMGMTHHATAATLSVFILGVAWGAWLLSRLINSHWLKQRWQDNTFNRMFAMIQFALAVWNGSLPWLFQGVDWLYVTIAPTQQNLLHDVCRIGGAILILLAPSLLMGMVFPLVSRAGVKRVYPVGMIGSVMGVLLMGLIIQPMLGTRQAMYLLAGINLLVGAGAWLLPGLEFKSSDKAEATVSQSRNQPRRLIMTVCLLGASLFMAESMWFKLIGLMVDATSYAQVMILAAVLCAMTIGAVINWRWKLPVTMWLLLAAMSQLLVILLPGLLIGHWHEHSDIWQNSFTRYLTSLFTLAMLLVTAPSLCMGALIPRLCQDMPTGLVARMWCWHHLGCAFGAIIGTCLIMPLIGVTGTIAIASGIIAIPLLTRKTWALAITVVMLCSFTALMGDATFKNQFNNDNRQIVFHHEDASGITEVYKNRNDDSLSLTSSRRRQEGGNHPDQVYVEKVQGQLPVALCSDAKDILIIGMGTGTTLGASRTEHLQTLTCVEISPGVIAASDFFKEANGHVFDDPRVELIEQDGRNFIKLNDKQYDLIVQELFFPYRQGVASLYAQEHYQRCKKRLKTQGKFAQWIALGQIGPDELKVLARTFTSVFKETSLWIHGGYLMFIGSDQLMTLQADQPMLGHFLADDQSIRQWCQEAPINTENHLLIESRLPRIISRIDTTELTVSNLAMLCDIAKPVTVMGDHLPTDAWQSSDLVRKAIIQRFNQHDAQAIKLYQQAFVLDRKNEQARRALVEHYTQTHDYHKLLIVEPSNMTALNNQGMLYYKQNRLTEAIACFERILAQDEAHVTAMFNLGNCHARLRQYDKAVLLYQKVLQHKPTHAKAI
ncbi:MAG: fused MFS/spermidine synthase, partial [Phycisphaeraceae bacterium JB051]